MSFKVVWCCLVILATESDRASNSPFFRRPNLGIQPEFSLVCCRKLEVFDATCCSAMVNPCAVVVEISLKKTSLLRNAGTQVLLTSNNGARINGFLILAKKSSENSKKLARGPICGVYPVSSLIRIIQKNMEGFAKSFVVEKAKDQRAKKEILHLLLKARGFAWAGGLERVSKTFAQQWWYACMFRTPRMNLKKQQQF